MRPQDVFRKDPDIVFRKISGEYILVPIRHRVGDLDNIYTLNETAARVWELIDGRRSVGDIRDAIAGEFEADGAQVLSDIEECLRQLQEMKAVC